MAAVGAEVASVGVEAAALVVSAAEVPEVVALAEAGKPREALWFLKNRSANL